MFDWNAAKRPIIGLAPMADYTDTPFALICKRLGGLSFEFREMVSAEAVVRGNEKTIQMARIETEERPVIQQIFGSDPATIAEAARIIMEQCQPDGIDVNMGCPVRKIVSNFDGASLIRDPERAEAIVKALKRAVNVPVSVKTRLGWEDDTTCLDFVPRLEAAGADLVTIHGRTKAQAYAGIANWDRVGEVADRVSIPVLVNGDVFSGPLAVEAIRRAHAAGCLIARGALGNPWIFKEVEASLRGEPVVPPTAQERIDAALQHARLVVEREGEKGLIGLRKHLPLYFKGPNWSKELRSALVRIKTLAEIETILSEI